MSDSVSIRDTSTELAKERNREAADRTLMAWIRTALSLIGFGFGIGKFYDYLETAHLHETLDPARSTLIFGASFITIGILGLLAAVIQHARIVNRLDRPDFAYAAMRPISMTVAILLLVIGAFAFIGIFL